MLHHAEHTIDQLRGELMTLRGRNALLLIDRVSYNGGRENFFPGA